MMMSWFESWTMSRLRQADIAREVGRGTRRPMDRPLSNREALGAFTDLSTPLLADACLRLQLPVRFAPPGVQPLLPEQRIIGRVVPARHFGSVDVFLEAMGPASGPGDVLVIDNGGRRDEGCIGDLIVLEAARHGLGGIVVWGAHRDTEELRRIAFPVFSYGPCPFGPRRLEKGADGLPAEVQFGGFAVSAGDFVCGDMDGVVFFPADRAKRVLEEAGSIRRIERLQAARIQSGESLRRQLRFAEYLRQRQADPAYPFREHLRRIGGAIEE